MSQVKFELYDTNDDIEDYCVARVVFYHQCSGGQKEGGTLIEWIRCQTYAVLKNLMAPETLWNCSLARIKEALNAISSQSH